MGFQPDVGEPTPIASRTKRAWRSDTQWATTSSLNRSNQMAGNFRFIQVSNA